MEEVIISDGVHYLSGIGECELNIGWYIVNAYFFTIDGVTYCTYEDPNDGYRSFGVFEKATEEELSKVFMYNFEPQKVIVKNTIEEERDENGWQLNDSHLLYINDAILNKTVLKVGTDHTYYYYPIAIFDYQPMNLYENVRRSIENE